MAPKRIVEVNLQVQVSDPDIDIRINVTKQVISHLVIHAASKVTETPVIDILSSSRKRQLVNIRKMCSAVLRSDGQSYPSIGRVLNTDHSTIICYCRKHADHLLMERDYATLYNRILNTYQTLKNGQTESKCDH